MKNRGKGKPKRHKLSQIDPVKRTAKCAYCGDTTVRRKAKGQGGWRCNGSKSEYELSRHGSTDRLHYRRYLKDRCERCGFVPEHKVQLDINHKDVDRYNNDPSNLETLCSNCHRLISYLGLHSCVRYGERRGTVRHPAPIRADRKLPEPEQIKQTALNLEGLTGASGVALGSGHRQGASGESPGL